MIRHLLQFFGIRQAILFVVSEYILSCLFSFSFASVTKVRFWIDKYISHLVHLSLQPSSDDCLNLNDLFLIFFDRIKQLLISFFLLERRIQLSWWLTIVFCMRIFSLVVTTILSVTHFLLFLVFFKLLLYFNWKIIDK